MMVVPRYHVRKKKMVRGGDLCRNEKMLKGHGGYYKAKMFSDTIAARKQNAQRARQLAERKNGYKTARRCQLWRLSAEKCSTKEKEKKKTLIRKMLAVESKQEKKLVTLMSAGKSSTEKETCQKS